MIERTPSSDMAEGPPAEGEATTIPLSVLGGQSVEPGDVVRLRVVSVDEDNGTVDVEYAHAGKGPDMMSMMANKFDEEPTGED